MWLFEATGVVLGGAVMTTGLDLDQSGCCDGLREWLVNQSGVMAAT